MRAHVCQFCGLDLSRLAAHVDPHYDLPLVRCGRCRAVHVRRRDPAQGAMRGLMRLEAALMRLAVQFTFIGGFTSVTLVIMFAPIAAMEEGIEAPPIAMAITLFVLLLVFPAALGTWLTAGFGHIDRGAVWIGWTVWIATIWLVAAISYSLINMPGAPWSAVWDTFVLISIPAMLYLMWLMLAATCGVPIGALLLRGGRAFRRARWQLRKKLRRRALLST